MKYQVSAFSNSKDLGWDCHRIWSSLPLDKTDYFIDKFNLLTTLKLFMYCLATVRSDTVSINSINSGETNFNKTSVITSTQKSVS